jgi:hypothetical protein
MFFAGSADGRLALLLCRVNHRKSTYAISYFGYCGLLSPASKLQAFVDEWGGLLRGCGSESLTMKRSLRHKIPLGSIVKAKGRDERNAAFRPFALCIRKHFEFGIAIVVNVEAYGKWPRKYKIRFAGGSDDPHYFAFKKVLALLMRAMEAGLGRIRRRSTPTACSYSETNKSIHSGLFRSWLQILD